MTLDEVKWAVTQKRPERLSKFTIKCCDTGRGSVMIYVSDGRRDNCEFEWSAILDQPVSEKNVVDLLEACCSAFVRWKRFLFACDPSENIEAVSLRLAHYFGDARYIRRKSGVDHDPR